MPNMKKNDSLKKHHFWILLGLVPLFVLIAVLTISSSVGGEIEKRNKEIEDAKGGLAKLSSPKSAALLELMDGVIKKVDGKHGTLWKDNWDRQAPLYVWPKSRAFTGFTKKDKGPDGKDTEVTVRLEDLKFGENIPNNNDQYLEFRKPEFYQALYSTAALTPGQKESLPPGFVAMGDSIAPTQFRDGWERILRYANDLPQYNKVLTSDQIWLLMEDVWVQRSMLQAVKSVNDEMSAFRRVKYDDGKGVTIDDPDPKNPNAPKDPLRRKFRSRVWEVALEVKTRGNKSYITGTLENITERLQVLGIGKTMTLKVWLEKNQEGGVEGIEPVEFRIGSDFLPGKGGTKRVKDKAGKDVEVPSNIVIAQPDENNDKEFDKTATIIPPGKNVAEIVKVEQVFDRETVPVRRVEAMAIGTMRATDSRYAAIGVLYKPPSPPFTNPETTAASVPGAPGPGSGGSLPPPVSTPMDSSGSGTSTAAMGMGGGPLISVVEGNRRRYVEITPQVRRMPVAIVAVVDQAYIQDMLLAFANSPLRFQITQVTWKRFRGNLGTGSNYDSTGSGGSVLITQPGSFGRDFNRSGDPDVMYPGARNRPPSPAPMPPFGSPPGPGGMAPFGMGMGMGSYDPYGGSSGSLTAVSEAQLTSGLVELSVYGIVSLYEKYNPATDTAADATTPKVGEPKEKDKEPKEKDKEKDKEPKDALPTAPVNPKMRVRRRSA